MLLVVNCFQQPLLSSFTPFLMLKTTLFNAKFSSSLSKTVVKLAQGDKIGAFLEATGIGAERLDKWIMDKHSITLREEILSAASTKLSSAGYDDFTEAVCDAVSNSLYRRFTFDLLYLYLDDPHLVAKSIIESEPSLEFAAGDQKRFELLLETVIVEIRERIDRFPGFMRWLVEKVRTESDPDRISTIARAEIKEDQAFIDTEFEAEYRSALYEELNRVELFVEQTGATEEVKAEENELKLSVAYVTLNLSADSGNSGVPLTPYEVLGSTPTKQCRKFILGKAGSGKTTLLRWFGLQTADALPVSTNQLCSGSDTEGLTDADLNGGDPLPILSYWWQDHTPFYIRLRDYKDGNFPTTDQFTKKILSRALPDNRWTERILDAGRGLILLDGLDELKPELRPEAMAWIHKLRLKPGNIVVISSRPQAVAHGITEGYDEYEIQELDSVTQVTFIDNWHKAVIDNLSLDTKSAEKLLLGKTALLSKISDNAELRKLVRNPLLCALLCAINRVYETNLPSTLDDLCKSAVRMLLWGRDKLQLKSDDHLVKAYADLNSADLRREIVEHIAKDFVMADEDVRPREAVLYLIRLLKNGRTEAEAEEILRGLIERSNLIRSVGVEEIEFVHNILRDFLASRLLAETNERHFLVKGASLGTLDRWEPLLGFVVGSESHSIFAQTVLEELLKKASKTKTQRTKLETLVLRISSFYRGQLPADIESKIDEVKQSYLPINTIDRAYAWATAGEKAIPYLRFDADRNGKVRAACAKVLLNIDTDESRLACDEFFGDSASSEDLNELIASVGIEEFSKRRNILDAPSAIERLIDYRFHSIAEYVINLQPLLSYPSIKSLNLNDCRVKDYSPLRDLKKLHTLYLDHSSIQSLLYLEGLTKLKSLSIRTTRIDDLCYLGNLQQLRVLRASRTLNTSVEPLFDLKSLESLDITLSPVESIVGLSRVQSLRDLYIDASVFDVEELKRFSSLRRLGITGPISVDILEEYLASAPTIRALRLSYEDVPRNVVLPISKKFATVRVSRTSNFAMSSNFIFEGQRMRIP